MGGGHTTMEGEGDGASEELQRLWSPSTLRDSYDVWKTDQADWTARLLPVYLKHLRMADKEVRDESWALFGESLQSLALSEDDYREFNNAIVRASIRQGFKLMSGLCKRSRGCSPENHRSLKKTYIETLCKLADSEFIVIDHLCPYLLRFVPKEAQEAFNSSEKGINDYANLTEAIINRFEDLDDWKEHLYGDEQKLDEAYARHKARVYDLAKWKLDWKETARKVLHTGKWKVFVKMQVDVLIELDGVVFSELTKLWDLCLLTWDQAEEFDVLGI